MEMNGGENQLGCMRSMPKLHDDDRNTIPQIIAGTVQFLRKNTFGQIVSTENRVMGSDS